MRVAHPVLGVVLDEFVSQPIEQRLDMPPVEGRVRHEFVVEVLFGPLPPRSRIRALGRLCHSEQERNSVICPRLIVERPLVIPLPLRQEQMLEGHDELSPRGPAVLLRRTGYARERQ